MAMFITFERRRRWIGTSISRSFNIFVNDSQDLSKTPKALIDTLINLTSSYDDDSEATRGRYLFNLRSLFALRLLSKPTVSSTIYNNNTNNNYYCYSWEFLVHIIPSAS